MVPAKVSKRYALALSLLAKEKDKYEHVYRDLKSLGKVIELSLEFQRFLENPEIDFEKRHAVFSAVLKERVETVTFDFLLFLAKKNRMSHLRSICQIFENLYLQDKGIVKAVVTTARRLDDDLLQTICSRLKSRLEKEIQPELGIDPSLISGFQIQVEDTIYDFSVKTQLQRFKQRVLSA